MWSPGTAPVRPTRHRLTDLLAASAAGRIQPRVMSNYSVEAGKAAIAELAGRRAVGQIVLTR